MSEFRMPSLGADMEAGTLVEWLKQPGDKVKRGDIVAVVETDKGAIEIEIFEDGVVSELLVALGQTVPVGTPLAMIDGAGAAPGAAPGVPIAPAPPASVPEPAPVPAAPAAVPPRPAPPPARPSAAPTPAAPAPSGDAGRLRISPVAAQRALELGVALAGMRGTGPGGAIRLADVEAAAGAGAPGAPAPKAPAPASEAPAAPAPAAKPASPQAALRRAIAASMARSKREIPHYYLGTTVDMTAALDWLEATNRSRGVAERLLPGVLTLKATALALKEVPELNGFWQDDAAQLSAAIHIGWAVSLRGGGLIAPAIHDVDAKPVEALMAELRDMVKRARSGGLRSSELSDPTITVTSLGERGVDTVLGVIYPPQLAIVGFGTTVERPWVVDGAVVPRRVAGLSLAADHRASDGHRGGLFLAALARLLQEPESL